MKPQGTFGLSDMAFYLPAPAVGLEELVRHRAAQGADATRLDRALRSTGQRQMRFPDWYEDTVTMVAEATRLLLERNRSCAPSSLRHYCCGTETPQDYAKPVASYCQGLLGSLGDRIGPQAAVYDVKHACAAGTYAVLGVLASMKAESEWGLKAPGVVTMGDIARYAPGTSAELTQGAGAVALLLEADPRLVALDLGLVGTSSRSVDDFFRAIGNEQASVRGRFSVDCYRDALAAAYLDYENRCRAAGVLSPNPDEHVLGQVDYAVLHAPFHSMPLEATEFLLVRALGLSPEAASAELERLRVASSVVTVRDTGNLYTASLYLCLADLLVEEYGRIGRQIEGKRILMASYGSGSTMVLFSGTVVPGAAEAIEQLAFREALERHSRRVSPPEYDFLLGFDRFCPQRFNAYAEEHSPAIAAGRYFLERIRQDGYRVYGGG